MFVVAIILLFQPKGSFIINKYGMVKEFLQWPLLKVRGIPLLFGVHKIEVPLSLVREDSSHEWTT